MIGLYDHCLAWQWDVFTFTLNLGIPTVSQTEAPPASMVQFNASLTPPSPWSHILGQLFRLIKDQKCSSLPNLMQIVFPYQHNDDAKMCTHILSRRHPFQYFFTLTCLVVRKSSIPSDTVHLDVPPFLPHPITFISFPSYPPLTCKLPVLPISSPGLALPQAFLISSRPGHPSSFYSRHSSRRFSHPQVSSWDCSCPFILSPSPFFLHLLPPFLFLFLYL